MPRTIVALALVSVMAVAGARALEKTGSAPMVLTGSDYQDIERLYSRSLHALGTGADNGSAFARSFAPNGHLTTPSGTLTGQRAIAEYGASARGRRYWLTNLLIEPAQGGANGLAYVAQSDGTTLVEAGLYRDALAKSKDGWRVTARTYLPGTQWPPRDMPDLPASASRGSRFTPTDYAEIKKLLFQYNVGYDNSGPFDKGLFSIQPFTADAIFERINGPTFQGAGIAAQSTGHKPLLHHWDSNYLISVSPDGEVRSFNYDMQFNVEEPGSPVRAGGAGVLQHRYVKTADGWRISFRKYAAVGSTPQITWPAADDVPFSAKLAPGRRSSGSPLSDADRVEIEQLYVLNNIAFDSAADEGRRYADTFTADGTVVRGGERIAGARALAAMVAATTPGLHNWISNLTIEPAKGGATGRVYVLSAAINGEPGVKQTRLTGMATCEDSLVRTPRGWRFKTRTVTPTPASTESRSR